MSGRVHLSILDGYAVRWNRATVARDVVQNFFDETDDFSEVAIEVDDRSRTVRVTGPSTFHLDYLRYVGATSKRAPERRASGGFGEGFKICALVLLRDHGADVRAGSGAWEIRPLLAEMKLGRELCYDVTELPPERAFPGSFVEILRADAALRRAFRDVRDEFRHPANPRLAHPIFVDDATGVGVYRSPDARFGDVFYRKQRRGRVRFAQGGALTFAMDAPVPDLEADRDRRDLRAVTPLVRAVVPLLSEAVLIDLVHRLRASWSRGHAILTDLLRECGRRELRIDFPPRWVARSKAFQHHALVEHADRAGLRLGVSHLALAGCPTVAERFGEDEREREPGPVEAARIAALGELFVDLAGTPCPARSARVVHVENPFGSGRRGSTARLPARLLAAPALDALAPLLSRLATVRNAFGSADSAAFLTHLLEGAVCRPERVAAFAQAWDEAAVDPAGVLARHPSGASLLDQAPREADFRDPYVTVVVLAPSGLPGAREMAQRIAERVVAAGGCPFAVVVAVDGLREALSCAAVGGLPCVQIGDRVVGAGPRAKIAYAPRVPRPDGAIWPSEAETEEAITQALAQARVRRRMWGKLRARGERALLRHLQRHDPAAHREALLDTALGGRVHTATRDRLPGSWWKVVFRKARPLVLASGDCPPAGDGSDEAVQRLGVLAGAAVEEAVAGLLPIQARFEAAFPSPDPGAAPASGDAAREDLRHHALEALVATLRATDDVERALAAARQVADRWAEAVSLADAASPDRDCERHALRTATKGQGADAVVDLDRLRELLDAATRWHLEPDALGRLRTCADFAAAAAEPARTGPEVREPEEDEVSAAVRDAWSAALAEGLSEAEALRRCLEVAEATRAAYPKSSRE